MWFLLTVIALLGVGILAALILILKKLSSLNPQIIIKNDPHSNLEDSVKGGMITAIKELEHEKEEHELLMKRLDRNQKGAMGVHTTANTEEPINTKGFLIPAHLTEEEKELLRMFYND